MLRRGKEATKRQHLFGNRMSGHELWMHTPSIVQTLESHTQRIQILCKMAYSRKFPFGQNTNIPAKQFEW